jgi:hypothetical protein
LFLQPLNFLIKLLQKVSDYSNQIIFPNKNQIQGDVRQNEVDLHCDGHTGKHDLGPLPGVGPPSLPGRSGWHRGRQVVPARPAVSGSRRGEKGRSWTEAVAESASGALLLQEHKPRRRPRSRWSPFAGSGPTRPAVSGSRRGEEGRSWSEGVAESASGALLLHEHKGRRRPRSRRSAFASSGPAH